MCSLAERGSCPSRYLCYEDGQASNDGEGSTSCLCNRTFLFYGKPCESTPILTYVTVALQAAHGLYTGMVIIYAIYRTQNRHNTAGDVRRTKFLCVLTGLTAMTMYIVDLVRLNPAFDDRAWETHLQFHVLALLLLFASLNVWSVALLFVNRLARAGVVKLSHLTGWKIFAYLCQATASGLCILVIVSKQKHADRMGFLVLGMLGVVFLLIGAAFRTQHYLAAVSNTTGAAHCYTTIRAQRHLVEFLKTFCFWMFLCLSCLICMTVFQKVKYPAVGSHLFHLGSVLSMNQVGVVESDYLLLPEKRYGIRSLLPYFFLKYFFFCGDRVLSMLNYVSSFQWQIDDLNEQALSSSGREIQVTPFSPKLAYSPSMVSGIKPPQRLSSKKSLANKVFPAFSSDCQAATNFSAHKIFKHPTTPKNVPPNNR